MHNNNGKNTSQMKNNNVPEYLNDELNEEKELRNFMPTSIMIQNYHKKSLKYFTFIDNRKFIYKTKNHLYGFKQLKL